MIGSLAKLSFGILDNKASIIAVMALLAWGSYAGYSWLQKHDAEIAAREEAKFNKLKLDQAEAARDAYATSVGEMMENRKRDEKAIAELQTFSDTQRALIDETLKQLEAAGGDWGGAVVPTNRQRVLAISLKRVEAAANLSDPSEGTAAGRAVEGLRGAILSKPN